jgi:electron transfer flavoprotein alpha subunit
MRVLVFIEQRNGKIKTSAAEALSVAKTLGETAAVLIGSGVSGHTGELAGYGVDTVYVLDHAALALYNADQYAAAVGKACESFKPDVVLGVASPMGRDLFPKLSVRHKGAMLTDMTELKASGDGLVGTKPMYAGKCLAAVTASAGGTKFVTIRPNVFPVQKTGGGTATATPIAFTPVESRLKTLEIRKGKSEKPDLTEASRIISGGRAMGNADNFKILHECSEVLDATVGASRAAVDSGYATHDMQVGQTGKTVNPNLYVACGISGSIQHMAGMRTSKVIVAINTDPEAPIFKVANYGIVGDLFQVVPELTKQLKDFLK